MLPELLDTMQHLAISKGGCTIVGWAVNDAIFQTLAATKATAIDSLNRTANASDDNSSASEELVSKVPLPPTTEVLVALLTLLLTILMTGVCFQGVSLALERLEKEEKEEEGLPPHEQARKDTLSALSKGLPLIPAWGFKDYVNVRILVNPRLLIIQSVDVLLMTTAVTLLIAPSARVKEQYPRCAAWLTIVINCTGLGVGYAINLSVKELATLAGADLEQFTPSLIWAPCVTVITVYVQRWLTRMDAESDTKIQKALIKYLKVSGNFVVAFAWDGLLDKLEAVVFVHRGVIFTDFMWALILTLVGSVIAWAHAVWKDPDCENAADLGDLLETVSAINIGWAFADVIGGIYKESSQFYPGDRVTREWIFCAITCFVVALIMAQSTRVIERIRTGLVMIEEELEELKEDIEALSEGTESSEEEGSRSDSNGEHGARNLAKVAIEPPSKKG